MGRRSERHMAGTRTRRAKKKAGTLREALRVHNRVACQEAILDAAALLFCRMGFGEVKVEAIAAETGVSVGTLYNYYDSKDAITDALLRREYRRLCGYLARAEKVTAPLERLRALLDETLKFLEERSALLAMATQAGMFPESFQTKTQPGVPEEARTHLLRVIRTALAEASVAGELRGGLEPAQLSLLVDGMLSAVIRKWLRSEGAPSLAQEADLVFDVLLNGVRGT